MSIERQYIRQLNESIQRNEDSSQKESLLHLIDFIENNTNFKIIDKDIDSDWGPGITIKSDAYKKIHVTVSAPKKKFNSYSAILFLDTPGVFDLSQTHKNFPAENIEEVFSTLVEKAKIYVKKLMKGKPGEWEEINKPDTVNPRELQKDMLAFIEESAQKNETIDPHSDSIENWKQAAKFFSDNNYNWTQVDGNYELYSDEIEFGFVCGKEDGVFEFFSTVGDEVKEFNSKRKLLSFLKKLGLPLLNDSPKSSSGWDGDKYYLRYDLNEGYIKVLVMYDKIDVNLYGTSSATEPIELALDASNEDIRAAVKKILTDYTSMESDQIDFIANSCPVENLERK